MANTTWNPADDLNVTLSGANLVATAQNSAGGVRSILSVSTGKCYWEFTGTAFWGGFAIAGGVANASANLGTVQATPTNAAWVSGQGGILVNSTTPSGNLGGQSTGAVIGVALDLTNKMIWFRNAPSGNWNGSGTANPATNTGGFSISAIAGLPLYGLMTMAGGLQNAAITANFGDTAFTGAVPAGFTSGFTAGPTNALVTQIAVEHWLTTNPPAQVTQVAIEHWATVTGTGLQAIATQVALEHWASVASVPVSVGAPMITMIG